MTGAAIARDASRRLHYRDRRSRRRTRRGEEFVGHGRRASIFPPRDTIFAPASGAGGRRSPCCALSGPACAAALAALAPGARFPDRVATLATLRDPASGETLDRALVIRFVAPRSFTGEEMAELQVTGGRAMIAGIVGALARLPGLRPAEAGEFAWRAFENGKLDLSEVEGLADLVDAETEAQRRQALRIAGGALSRDAEAIRAEARSRRWRSSRRRSTFSDVEDADALSLDRRARSSAEAARADARGARRRRGRRAAARGFQRRHRRPAQCRQIDADERAGAARRVDRLGDSRHDARSRRSVARPAAAIRSRWSTPRACANPTIRSSARASRARGGAPRGADLTLWLTDSTARGAPRLRRPAAR